MDHRFSVFGTSVYPRRMYAEARDFIMGTHDSSAVAGVSFEDIMADTEESWAIPAKSGQAAAAAAASCTLEDRETLLPDFAFMEAFMW